MSAGPYEEAAYPFRHVITARFADLDPLGHLNNVAITAFYEDARVALMQDALGEQAAGALGFSGGFPVVLAEITVRYLAEAHFPGTYVVGAGIARVGTTSVTVDAALFRDGTCAGTSRAVLVHVDPATHRPAPVPDDIRALLQKRAVTA